MADGAPITFSYSRLRSVDQCELSYCLRYVERRRGNLDSIERFVGTCVHTVIEEDHEGKLGRSPIAAWERLSEVWDRDYRPGKVFDVRDYGVDYWRGHALSCISNYMRMGKPYGTVLGVEARLEGELMGAHKLMGIVDRWLVFDGRLEIHDFKTGKPPRGGHNEFLADQQLPIYAALAARERGIPDDQPITVKRIYLGPGKIDGYEVHQPRRAEAIEWARSQAEKCMRAEATYRASREAEASRGILCKWCSYYHAGCPAWSSSPI